MRRVSMRISRYAMATFVLWCELENDVNGPQRDRAGRTSCGEGVRDGPAAECGIPVREAGDDWLCGGGQLHGADALRGPAGADEPDRQGGAGRQGRGKARRDAPDTPVPSLNEPVRSAACRNRHGLLTGNGGGNGEWSSARRRDGNGLRVSRAAHDGEQRDHNPRMVPHGSGVSVRKYVVSLNPAGSSSRYRLSWKRPVVGK